MLFRSWTPPGQSPPWLTWGHTSSLSIYLLVCSPQTSAGWGTRAPHAGGGLCYVNHPWAVLANGSNFGNSHSTDEWRQCKQSADHPCVLHRRFGDATLTSVTAVSPEWLERIYGAERETDPGPVLLRTGSAQLVWEDNKRFQGKTRLWLPVQYWVAA